MDTKITTCDKCKGLPFQMAGYINSSATKTIVCDKCKGSGVVLKVNIDVKLRK